MVPQALCQGLIRVLVGTFRARIRRSGAPGRYTGASLSAVECGSPVVKKGRHRRFEEARKLKQSGPGAFDLGLGDQPPESDNEDDQYAALAEKYGVTFDDDDQNDD